MKIFLTEILSVAVLCGLSVAQEPVPPQSDNTAPQQQQSPAAPQAAQSTPGQSSAMQPTTNVRIAPGSVIPVQLTKSIDAKKAKTGDEIDAKVTQDMKAVNGTVLVAKDTKVIGHVTEAQARSKDQKESQVGIVFDRAVMNGSDVTLPMSIQAIVAPPNLNANSNSNSNNNAPSESAGQPGPTQGNNNARGGGMGASTPTTAPNAPTLGDESSTSAPNNTNVRQPTTGATQGVVGIANLKLAMADDTARGSLVSSEKGNVKLEIGTVMLLKVNR
jgi:hypothetical protein